MGASAVAQLYESLSQTKSAEQYLKVAEKAFEKMPSGSDQVKTELMLGILKARIELDRKQYAKSQSLLENNLEIYSRQPFPSIFLLSQSLTLLAQTYAETGQTTRAADTFNRAINVVENDDQYLQSEKLRVKFDDERRELYDSAIDFQYGSGARDVAWTYLQKYRSKLFIEFLAQFDPNVGATHAQALDWSRVQALLPADAQVIEYALLKNRLLIWVISKNLFISRSLAIPRSTIEAKVEDVLQKLRNQEEVDALLTDLGKVLIEPIADQLDSNRTVVIIPDRALHGLPFEVLRRPGKSQYLIQEFPILISPNLTHLLLTKAVRPLRVGIMGFASRNGDSSEAKELAAITAIYPKTETFVGTRVEKPTFLGAMAKATVLHYAGHSATDAVDPLRSSILLDGNRFGPNSVTAVDIAQQRLQNNALVVLSSCDSSVGNSRDGIGMRGLTSAFLIGGAGSVVGSLWPVEASSTADLMIRFHRAFANGQLPVAKALREAQLGFLRSFPERSHPYYWSGFVVTGNFSALR
jgi:CHAT domain-containing protein